LPHSCPQNQLLLPKQTNFVPKARVVIFIAREVALIFSKV